MRYEESRLQQNCVRWFRYQFPQFRQLLFAVPNGGRRSAKEAAIMNGEGVTAGVADLILLKPSERHNALCIEVKSPKGKQSEAQKNWQEAAEKQGNCYKIVRSFDEFQNTVLDYLYS